MQNKLLAISPLPFSSRAASQCVLAAGWLPERSKTLCACVCLCVQAVSLMLNELSKLMWLMSSTYINQYSTTHHSLLHYLRSGRSSKRPLSRSTTSN